MSHFYRKWTLRNEATEGGEDGGGAVTAQDGQKTEGEAAKSQPNETEDKARRMGWVPKEEFRGDPDKWRPADEFVERGENMVPILRATVKKQERELAEIKATLQQFAEFHSKTEQRAYEKALNELRQERAAAIAAGDGAKFDKVDGEIEELKRELGSKKTQTKVTGDGSIPPEQFEPWLARNPWANDKKLQIIGHGIAEALVAEGETARGTDLLDLVAKEIKQRYPEKFENPRRQGASSVEGAASAPRKSGKTYADLPPEAKAACDTFTKQKLLTREQYVKQFFDQE